MRVDPVKDETGEVWLHAYVFSKGVSKNMYNICVKLHEASKQGLTILPLEIVDMLKVRGITMMGPALEYGPFNLGKAERYKDVRDPLVLTISWKTLSPAMRDSALLDPGTYTSTCFVDLYGGSALT